MMNKSYSLPAEWRPVEAVLLSWPHEGTDWMYMLSEVRECFKQIALAIAERAKVIIVAPDIDNVKSCFPEVADDSRFVLVQLPTNDTWARDFGMICTVTDTGEVAINDFKFNGWGLKFAACHDNLITKGMMKGGMKADRAEYVNRLNFVLEGGSIESDDNGTVLTTSNCLLSPNRNGAWTKQQIEANLIDALGCQRVLWVDHGDLQGDDTDSHIDTLARFMPGNVIACSTCDRPDDEHFECLNAMVDQISRFHDCEGKPYRIVNLPIPEAIYDDDGQRLPATYANFLIVNKTVLVPVYADEHYDSIALRAIKEAMPDYDVVGIDCRALICQHGSLHCMTMQIPYGALKL